MIIFLLPTIKNIFIQLKIFNSSADKFDTPMGEFYRLH